MATTFKRPNTRFWQIRYTDRTGAFKYASAKCTDRRVAEARAKEIEDREWKIRRGLLSAAAADLDLAISTPIATHVAAHLDADRQRGLHPRRIAVKESTLRRFVAEEKVDSILKIDPKAVRRHLRRLVETGVADATGARKRLSAATANEARRTILRFLNWLVEEGRLASNPCAGRAVPALNAELDRRRRRRPFTESELDLLLRRVEGTPRAAVYRLAVLTGLRRSELAALRWGDVDLDADLPHLRLRAEATKARRSEELPLHPDAVATLRSLLPSRPDPAALVVERMPTVQRLYRDLAEAGIQKVDGRRAVPDASDRVLDFHSFRQTLATLLANRGVSSMHLKRLMRHASIETTDRHYTGLRISDLGRELDRLGSVAGAGAPDRLPTGMPTLSARNGAGRGDSGRMRRDPAGGAGSSQVSEYALLGESVRDSAIKAGEGSRTLDIHVGNVQGSAVFPEIQSDSQATANRNANSALVDADRRAVLADLHSAVADLPTESLKALVTVARALRSGGAPPVLSITG